MIMFGSHATGRWEENRYMEDGVTYGGWGISGINEVSKFIATQEECRVRIKTDTSGGQQYVSFKYEYFLKDHLGNTRMVLTDQQQPDLYPAATMETANSATEELYYNGLENTRTPLPPGYPTDTTTNPNAYVARLSGGRSRAKDCTGHRPESHVG